VKGANNYMDFSLWEDLALGRACWGRAYEFMRLWVYGFMRLGAYGVRGL
jgi:hypothetical protein